MAASKKYVVNCDNLYVCDDKGQTLKATKGDEVSNLTDEQVKWLLDAKKIVEKSAKSK